MRRRSALRQRGVALLAAMLTVTLVATIAAAAVWQQWRNLEVEGAERTRVQAAWLLLAGLDFSRLILREDARQGGVDDLSEPWAVPLAEARLSTFLQAQNNQSQVGDDTIDAQAAFLSGMVVDAQSRLNVRNLISANQIDPFALQQFSRLFARLGLSGAELTRLTQAALLALREDKVEGTAPLVPRTWKELAWWGLSPATLQALEPYATILPIKTPVNINTASATVLYAAVDKLDPAAAQQITQLRQSAPFKDTADLLQRVPRPALQEAVNRAGNPLSTSTNYFEVWARLRFDDLVVQERSLVYRQGLAVTTVVRERGAALPSEPGSRS
ncbi:MAG: type II secretion system minor pseudopilin GspK [Comamonas sp.]